MIPKKKSPPNKWLILILAVAVLVLVLSYFQPETAQTAISGPQANTSGNSKLYKFKLTECLGRELPEPATFTVDAGSTTNWLLDYNNGSSLTYTIITGNEYDPMCGLKAKDSNDDLCEICIKKNEDDRTTITFDYSGRKLIYKGDYIQ